MPNLKRRTESWQHVSQKDKSDKSRQTPDGQPIYISIRMNGRDFICQVDTGSQDNIRDQTIWKMNQLCEPDSDYIGVGNELMGALEEFKHSVKVDANDKSKSVKYVVTKQALNILGITTLFQLHVSFDVYCMR